MTLSIALSLLSSKNKLIKKKNNNNIFILIAHLSAKSSKCCPIASTLYPSRLAHAYNRPRFIREQKLQIDSQTVSWAACSIMPVKEEQSKLGYLWVT